MKARRKPRRIVLATGHPWFGVTKNGASGQWCYNTLHLTETPVNQSILLRGGEKLVDFKFSDIGNWNKVRVILEVIK